MIIFNTFLYRRPLSCSSNYHSCTCDHFPAEAATSPPLATTSLQKQLPVLHRRPPSCNSDHLLTPAAASSAPAATNPAPVSTFPQQRPPSCTSSYHVLHQQLPALPQRPPSYSSRYQRLPVVNKRPSSCISRNQPCTSDHRSNDYQSCTNYPDLYQRLDPAPTITIRPRRLFAVRFSDLRFAIIKFGLLK